MPVNIIPKRRSSFALMSRKAIRVGSLLQATPVVGLRFRPDSTDAIATIHTVNEGAKMNRGKREVSHTVTYSYAHAPEVRHSRPYREVVGMAWSVVS